jgi:hypothetical protein
MASRKRIPIFGLFDYVRVGADHLHAQALQDAGVGHRDGGVEARLAAQGGEQGVGALPLDDLAHRLRGDGLDVGAVRHLRVRHDGGRIGVDEHHLVALFPQGLAGLGAGVVEFAGLGNDDGAGADDEDFLMSVRLGILVSVSVYCFAGRIGLWFGYKNNPVFIA